MTDYRFPGLSRWLITLAIGLFAYFAGHANAVASPSPSTATTLASDSAYTYDSTANSSAATASVGIERAGARAPSNEVSAVPAGFVAADSAGTTAGDLAKSCVNSFTADTPVTMADGGTKPIKDVKVGDKVLATDPYTGQTKAEPVVALIRHTAQHQMVLVTLADGSVLDATGGHKIWDATQYTFVDASGLHVGDKFETDTGVLITVAALTDYLANLTAYNLQINQIHTYYAGTTPVLVHNSCGPLTTGQVTQMAERVGIGRRIKLCAVSGCSRTARTTSSRTLIRTQEVCGRWRTLSAA